MQEKIDRVEDSICAVRSAKDEGVLAGGGTALLSATGIKDLGFVIRKSITTPYQKLRSNAGIEPNGEPYPIYPNGYDVKEFKETNMFEAGIVDSTKAIKHAFINAVSASNTILLTNNVVTNQRAK